MDAKKTALTVSAVFVISFLQFSGRMAVRRVRRERVITSFRMTLG
jgi:hypothetical protein